MTSKTSNVRVRLSSADLRGAFQPSGPRRRYRKDVIRTGRFFVPKMRLWLEVTPDRMDRWVSTFDLMRRRGVKVDLTLDHLDPGSAESKRGELVRLQRLGDTLYADVEVADAETELLLARCPEVSLELDQGFQDGLGNTYDEALTAVTICRQPVVPGQQPFLKIAASLRGGAAAPTVVLSAVADRYHNDGGSLAQRIIEESERLVI